MRRLRSTLILAIALLALSGAGCSLFRKTGPANPSVNAVFNTNSAITITPEPEGTPLSEVGTLGAVQLTFMKTYRSTVYSAYTAGSAKEFVVVTFTFASSAVESVRTGIDQSVRLQDGSAELKARYVDITGLGGGRSKGALAFVVESGARERSLSLGSKATIQLNP